MSIVFIEPPRPEYNFKEYRIQAKARKLQECYAYDAWRLQQPDPFKEWMKKHKRPEPKPVKKVFRLTQSETPKVIYWN